MALTQLMASNDVFQEVGPSGLYVTVMSEDMETPGVLTISFDKTLYLPGEGYECSLISFHRPAIVYIPSKSYVAIMLWSSATGWTTTSKMLPLDNVHSLKQLVETTNNFFHANKSEAPAIMSYSWKTQRLEIKSYTLNSEMYTVRFNDDLMEILGFARKSDNKVEIMTDQPYEENDLCLLECDILSPIVSNPLPRVLRILRGAMHNSLVPVYIPVEKPLISQITLKLLDIKARPVNILKGHCVAVLHIRPRHG